jgi:hypothetical protein
MILTAHVNHEGQKVVAIIDEVLLGHRFDEDDLELNFDSSFYRGEVMAEPAIIGEIRSAYMLNCAGEETIAFLIERGFIDRDDVAIIAGVPYVYVVFNNRSNSVE